MFLFGVIFDDGYGKTERFSIGVWKGLERQADFEVFEEFSIDVWVLGLNITIGG